MPKYRVERTELVTRVFEIEAATEDDAWEGYFYTDPVSEQHSGHPDVRVTEIK